MTHRARVAGYSHALEGVARFGIKHLDMRARCMMIDVINGSEFATELVALVVTLILMASPLLGLWIQSMRHQRRPDTACLWVSGIFYLITLPPLFGWVIFQDKAGFFLWAVPGFLLTPAGLPIGLINAMSRRTPRPVMVGRCERCGYDLRATPDRCPECGAASSLQPPAAKRSPQTVQPMER